MDKKRDIVFKQFHMIDRLTKIYLRQGLKDFGLKDVGHPYILKVLTEPGNNGLSDTQKDLAKRLMISPAAIAQSLKRMANEGLVEKLNDESDMRVNQVAITPKGMEFLEKIDANLHNAAETILSDFTEEELEQIY